MSAPRVRVYTDGRLALKHAEDREWMEISADGWFYVDSVSDADVHGEGWSEAALVALPEPVDITPVCGCGRAPDGAPGAAGCCNECAAPSLAWFEGGVSLDVECGAIYDGTGRTFEPDAAGLQAARLLSAAALWRAIQAGAR